MFASISGLQVGDEGRIYMLGRQVEELRSSGVATNAGPPIALLATLEG